MKFLTITAISALVLLAMAEASPSDRPGCIKTVSVKSGDTFESISKAYNITEAELFKYNPGLHKLNAGSLVCVADGKDLGKSRYDGKDGKEHGKEYREHGRNPGWRKPYGWKHHGRKHRGRKSHWFGEPGKDGRPGRDHGRPGRDHGEPGKDHGRPGKDHGEPGKDHGEPGKDHGRPGKDHGEPGKDHGEPGKDHGRPGKDHGE
ncbi:hypothetical protein BC937DRAFT_91250, partial [Endogone sp. FLAS-F59071]